MLNSQVRRIDLFCKLIGPLVISLIDGFATEIAISVTFGMTVLSVAVEYLAIAQVSRPQQNTRQAANLIKRVQVFKRVPALQTTDTPSTRERLASQDSGVEIIDGSTANIAARLCCDLSRFKLYFSHRDFLPSMALSLLYFTVLSFAGQMVTYLLSVGYSSTHIGLIRTVSVAFEISATWLGPVLMTRVGVIRAGLWSISWQMFCIGAAVAAFLTIGQPFIAAAGLIAGVVGSRIGLWIFDLCVQNIVQEVSALISHITHTNNGARTGGGI